MQLFGVVQGLLDVRGREPQNLDSLRFCWLTLASFDPASLAILDRVNHAISLLERPPSSVPGGQETQAPSPASLITPQTSGQDVNASPSETVNDAGRGIASADTVFVTPEYPACVTSCESILRWPVFEGSVQEIQSFILKLDDDGQTTSSNSGGVGGSIQEEDFIPLSKRFLAYVHIKNPILDLAGYRSYVREAASNGIGWDGPSCLVV